ncbi:MAG: hypothetical protein K8E66_09990 [Phycisphaerales bacterium]|nr:hypothetical protein [Phycisphaerales bacterium]
MIRRTTALFLCAFAVATLLAAPATAQTPITNAIDFHEELDVGEPGVPYHWIWDTSFFVLPNAGSAARPWIYDRVEVVIDIAFTPVTHGLGWGFLSATGDDWNDPLSAQITTVYGHDANHGTLEPLLAGLNPADPEYAPESDELIIARHGNEYHSTEAMTVPIFQLPDLLPGHDLSMVDFSDPFSVVHVFRTYAPMNEVYYPCPADMNNDGLLDLVDITSFIAAFTTQQLAADFDGNGIYDLVDVVGFIESFTDCP